VTWDPDDARAFRAEVQSALDRFVYDQATRLLPLGSDAARLVSAAHIAVRGGKRFRASFCHWGFRAVRYDVPDRPALVRAAAALELLHASALVHDDLMDDSDTRRGRPSTHRAFADLHQDHRWSGGSEQYGAAAAILLGDLLLSWSDEMLRRCGLGHDVVGPALEFFDTTRSEVVAGQFLDVSAQARGESDVDLAMLVLRYKSAKYSIERPLHVGAALAGGSPQVLEGLSAFGLPLGEAFQLRDDLLGVFGDPEVTGKPAGDDLAEGKRTVLVALALNRAPATDAKQLEDALGRDLGGEEVSELRRIIEASGAQSEVEERIRALTEQALAALGTAPVDDRARAVLAELADAATQRIV
jgi:geranylgeranyl diphosphate synthase, type I